MIRVVALFAVVILINACSPVGKDNENSAPPISGVELEGMDNSIPPQQDFFQFANGTWLASTAIPDDKSTWGSFAVLREEALHDLKAIVTQLPAPASASPSEKTLAYFYQSFMDEQRIEELGLKPLQNKLAAINALSDHAELARALRLLDRPG